ncbi:hypothetical protein FC759_24400 [Citrobacter freundii]|nr:hypothetical protein E0E99_17665 [Citrobacter freundii]TBW00505.1 hypothetical protein E0F20_19090 [Citrobacter freundii]TKI73016.1 hypothetical protein FC759_24400 [Citrobacter freundii]
MLCPAYPQTFPPLTVDRARVITTLFRSLTDVLLAGISLPPAASVPRPDGHGTGFFIAQARRRCDCTPCPRQFKARPSSRFRGISWPSKQLTAAVFHGRR